MPTRTITARDSVPVGERHLVIAAFNPAARREIFLSVKPGGHIGYIEYLMITYVTSSGMNPPTGSGFTIGTTVIANFTSDAGWSGAFLDDTTHSAFALQPGGKMQRLPTPTDHRAVPRALKPDEISSVRSLATWMQNRCQK